MTTPTVTELVRNGNRIHDPADVGERAELARYTVSTGERILYGQRIAGVVRITDCPASGRGRAYLVERELERETVGAYAALRALVADYLAQARRHDEVPMATSAVSRHLAELALSAPGAVR
jgi:hypothetical protein